MSLHTWILGVGSLALMNMTGLAQASAVGSGADRALNEQVELSLAEHAGVGWSLTVQTINGIVYLGGTTTTGYSRSLAEEVARGVPGVKKVVDIATIEC